MGIYYFPRISRYTLKIGGKLSHFSGWNLREFLPIRTSLQKKTKQFLQFKEKLYQTQPWIYIGSHINRQPWRATENARICTNLKDLEIAVCCETHSVMSDSLQPRGLYSAWNSPGQNTGVSKPFPSPGDLPNPGIEPRSPALQLRHQGSHQGAHPNLLFKDQLRLYTAFTFSVLLTTHLTIKCLLHCGHKGDSGAKP